MKKIFHYLQKKKIISRLGLVLILIGSSLSNIECPKNTFLANNKSCLPCESLFPHCATCLQNMTCTSCLDNYILQEHEENESDDTAYQYCDRAFWIRQWWGIVLLGLGSVISGILFSVCICIFAKYCMRSKLNKVRACKSKKKVGLFRKKKKRKYSMEAPRVTHEFTENLESQENLREFDSRLEFQRFREEIRKTKQANEEFDWNRFRMSLDMERKESDFEEFDRNNLSNEAAMLKKSRLPPITMTGGRAQRVRFSVVNPDINLNRLNLLQAERRISNKSPQISVHSPINELIEEIGVELAKGGDQSINNNQSRLNDEDECTIEKELRSIDENPSEQNVNDGLKVRNEKKKKCLVKLYRIRESIVGNQRGIIVMFRLGRKNLLKVFLLVKKKNMKKREVKRRRRKGVSISLS